MLKDYAETDGMGGDPAKLKNPCILVARYAFMYHNVAQDAVWKRPRSTGRGMGDQKP